MVRLCLAVLLLVLLPGCRQPGDAMGTTIRFDARGDRVAATPLPRATSLTLPADFPRDVHLPARYAIDTLTEMPGTRVVSLFADGDVVSLSQETRRAMARQGWQPRLATHHGGDSAVLAFEKAGRSALFAFDRNRPVQPSDDAGVIVSLQLQDGLAVR
ncbi:conserved exported hypothetical protein [Luteimonas sp. 9C]|uniref:hypothetical protein n=1 Tax=Luteimonas sp. 9C TaxID=2653148 RepID=UPI0012EFF649|nr:hypothetical protein [Luteimonas sp. 9C]VXB16341.1 conserved exported hypothetical protein [Luteimonas sp. 9C]